MKRQFQILKKIIQYNIATTSLPFCYDNHGNIS